jgi:hypothetical protein
VDGGELGILFPVVQDQHLSIADVEGQVVGIRMYVRSLWGRRRRCTY